MPSRWADSRILLIYISAVLFLCCAKPKIGGDWSTFRGDYLRTGVSDDPGPSDNPQIIWELDLGSKSSSSPIATDGRLFIGHSKGITCANAYTGELLWEFETAKKVFSTPTYFHGDVYFGSWDGRLYRLNGQTGRSIWEFRTVAAIDCSPVVTDETVYAGNFLGRLYALDIENTSIRWKFSTGNWIIASPAFDGKALYFGSRDSVFYSVFS